MLSWVEHEKKFYNLEAWFPWNVIRFLTGRCVNWEGAKASPHKTKIFYTIYEAGSEDSKQSQDSRGYLDHIFSRIENICVLKENSVSNYTLSCWIN